MGRLTLQASSSTQVVSFNAFDCPAVMPIPLSLAFVRLEPGLHKPSHSCIARHRICEFGHDPAGSVHELRVPLIYEATPRSNVPLRNIRVNPGPSVGCEGFGWGFQG